MCIRDRIDAAQQIAINLDFVRVVEIIVEQETQKIGLASLDNAFQLVGHERAIAHELNLNDPCPLALFDFENKADATILVVDRLRLDARIETSVAAVNREDALNVVVHQRTRERAALLDCTRGLSCLSLSVLVPSKAIAASDQHRGF